MVDINNAMTGEKDSNLVTIYEPHVIYTASGNLYSIGLTCIPLIVSWPDCQNSADPIQNISHTDITAYIIIVLKPSLAS